MPELQIMPLGDPEPRLLTFVDEPRRLPRSRFPQRPPAVQACGISPGYFLRRFLVASASARCFAVAVCFGFTLRALAPERLAFGFGVAFPFVLGFALAFFGADGLDLLLGGGLEPEERLGGALVTFASPLPAASAAAASSAIVACVGASSSTAASPPDAPLQFPFSDSTTSATALTRSPFFRFITRTPWVARPIREIPSTEVRCTIPFCEMKISSWPSRTTRAPARPPFLATSLMVSTPFVPRPLTG